MRFASLLTAAVLAWVSATSGQAVRCGMDEHACCGSKEVAITNGAECPLVSPAIPEIADGERSVHGDAVAIVEPATVVEPLFDVAHATIARSAAPRADSPPGGLVLRV